MKSYVIVDKNNEPIFETFNSKIVNAINTDKYKAVPIRQYLEELNKRIKNAELTNGLH